MNLVKSTTHQLQSYPLRLRSAARIGVSRRVQEFFRALESPDPYFFELLRSLFACYAVFDYLNFIATAASRCM